MKLKFYKMTLDQEQSRKGVLAQVFENSDWDDLPWLEGIEIQEEVREPIEYRLLTGKAKMKYNFYEADYFESDLGQPIVSTELWSAFKTISQKLQKYKTKLFVQKEALQRDYYALNMTNSFKCMNLKESEFSTSNITGKEDILVIRKLCLSEEKLSQIPRDQHIFRLAEFTPVIILDEYEKNLIEEAKVIGVEFTELEVAE